MSISKQVTVWCDNCQNWEQFSCTAKEARKELKQRGWKNNGRDDLCTECVKQDCNEPS